MALWILRGGLLAVVLWFLASWLAYKQRRLLLWLGWSILGWPLSLLSVPILGRFSIVLILGWYVGLVVLPLWWLVKRLWLRPSEPLPSAPVGESLAPIVDKDGRQIFP